ncbi:VOC family protein [Sphingomonas sp. C3-2]|uniref:VOC family protein n=1 Tax=Sphingomonas sp. C3-2 TaxID=3062169 RepID=UPI00294B381E|nr:VOC family protein [Sphingomonas sp. C3-2]WOK37442.1 VOC family protein [Sphingomonas sp. C3-2]
MAIRSLAYVVLDTADVEAWRSYGENVLGLQASDHPEGIRLRMDERPFRFLVRKSDKEQFHAAGLVYPDKAAYERGLEGLRKAGVALEPASAEEAKDRLVVEFVRCVDPSGNRLEIGWGRVIDGNPFVSPAGVSGFVTGEMGLGHVVFPALKLEETRAFYIDQLGFGDTDFMRAYLQGGGPEDPGIGMYFLHCDNPRHHTVALGEFPVPSGLIHMMLEVPTLDDVGQALDRAIAAGVHISSSLGKHMNDKMVSFYMRTPSGFDIEYGFGGIQPDWKTFTPTISVKEDEWGHRWDFG